MAGKHARKQKKHGNYIIDPLHRKIKTDAINFHIALTDRLNLQTCSERHLRKTTV